MSEVTLTPLHAGSCTARDRLIHQQGQWSPTIFPAGCAIIRHHREGTFLIDTGYSPRFFTATQPFPERLYRWATPVALKRSQTLRYQLEEMGVSPSELRGILLTHLHADHIAGARDFEDLPFHFHPEGLLGMNLPRPARVRKGFLPELMPDTSTWNLLTSFTPWRGDLRAASITSDRRILMIELPGHAPGHCGVYVETDSGPVLFAADAAWFHHEFEQRLHLTQLGKGILWDSKAYRQTQQHIQHLKEQLPDLRILLSHQPKAAA